MNPFALFSLNPFIYFAGLIILAIIAAAIIDHYDQIEYQAEKKITDLAVKFLRDEELRRIEQIKKDLKK